MITAGMSHGKPIVATRVNGILECVADCESHYPVEGGDTAQWLSAVLPSLRNATFANESDRLVG
jgi:glycosyltransferase involved in cell wall biosynthesis